MNEVLDYELYNDIHSYLQYRRDCFNHYIKYKPNVDFDRIINARYAKVSRIKKHLLYILYHCKFVYFLTFTFDDSIINKCERTKKDLIKHCLQSFSSDILIILNKDFGSLTEREHYHAIVGTNSKSNLLTHLLSTYPCRVGLERVRKDSTSFTKLSKYINKLTNHCCKDSTKNSRIYFNFNGFGEFHNDCPEASFIYQDLLSYFDYYISHTLPC